MRRVASFVYWLAALTVTALLLWQMDRYLRAPTGRVWDSVASEVTRDWRRGDRLHFTPDWLAGYALDRKRFHRIDGPARRVRRLDEVLPGERVWVFSGGWEGSGSEHLTGFQLEEERAIGAVRIRLLERGEH